MKVMVQQLGTGLYLRNDRAWVGINDGPMVFRNAISAISFSIRQGARDVRLVSITRDGHGTYIYPFGHDPAVRLERKRLRKVVAKNRELKRERRTLLARIDSLRAEAKERKKQFPFPRRPLGTDPYDPLPS